jgi:hypothetical protein
VKQSGQIVQVLAVWVKIIIAPGTQIPQKTGASAHTPHFAA